MCPCPCHAHPCAQVGEVRTELGQRLEAYSAGGDGGEEGDEEGALREARVRGRGDRS